METTTIVAADLVAGDFIHRVEKKPLSRVFERPVDERVLEVTPFETNGEQYVRVLLDTPFKSTLNLQVARKVDVVR